MPGDGLVLGPYPEVIALVLHFRKLLKLLGEQRYSTALPYGEGVTPKGFSSGRKMCFPKEEF